MGVVSATDGDGKDPNRKFSYYIQTGGMDKFRINGNTGLITVDLNAKIDREEYDEYSLTVIAIDRGTPPLNGTAIVVISIKDENDEKPEFFNTEFKTQMKENKTYTNVTQCSANDKDLHSHLNYTIIKIEPTYSQLDNKNESIKVSNGMLKHTVRIINHNILFQNLE